MAKDSELLSEKINSSMLGGGEIRTPKLDAG